MLTIVSSADVFGWAAIGNCAKGTTHFDAATNHYRENRDFCDLSQNPPLEAGAQATAGFPFLSQGQNQASNNEGMASGGRPTVSAEDTRPSEMRGDWPKVTQQACSRTGI